MKGNNRRTNSWGYFKKFIFGLIKSFGSSGTWSSCCLERKCFGLSDGGEDRNNQAWFISMGQSSASI